MCIHFSSFIYIFAVKKYLDLKTVKFSVLKVVVHGDMFDARQHNPDGIFHFH